MVATNEERIAKLENSMRRWKIGACLASFVALAAIGVGAGREKILEADSLLINDPNGQTRAMLSYEQKTDSAQLTFFDAKQQTLSTFWAEGNGMTGMTFYDKNIHRRLRVGMLARNTLALQIQSEDGKETTFQIPTRKATTKPTGEN